MAAPPKPFFCSSGEVKQCLPCLVDQHSCMAAVWTLYPRAQRIDFSELQIPRSVIFPAIIPTALYLIRIHTDDGTVEQEQEYFRL